MEGGGGNRRVRLVAADGARALLSEPAASLSRTACALLECSGPAVLDLSPVVPTGRVLAVLADALEATARSGGAAHPRIDIPRDVAVDVANAACFLDAPALESIACDEVARHMRGQSPGEMARFLGLARDE